MLREQAQPVLGRALDLGATRSGDGEYLEEGMTTDMASRACPIRPGQPSQHVIDSAQTPFLLTVR
jgi:hypothetical protein